METYKDLKKKFYERKTFNKLGDVSKIEFFADIDESTNEMFNLSFIEKIVIARNQNTGIPLNRNTIREQIKVDEVIFSENFVENFNKSKGMEINQIARTNLIFIAQEFALNKLIETHGETQGMENAKIFLNSVENERAKYITGLIDELLLAIKNCQLSFITTEIKTELDKILNVRY